MSEENKTTEKTVTETETHKEPAKPETEIRKETTTTEKRAE